MMTQLREQLYMLYLVGLLFTLDYMTWTFHPPTVVEWIPAAHEEVVCVSYAEAKEKYADFGDYVALRWMVQTGGCG